MKKATIFHIIPKSAAYKILPKHLSTKTLQSSATSFSRLFPDLATPGNNLWLFPFCSWD